MSWKSAKRNGFWLEQMGSMSELRGVQCRPMVVTGDPFDGILRAAAGIRADLVVMGSHRKQLLLDIFVGTTIERVIRKGSLPVLMVNNEAQRRYEKVVVPLEMSETSADALQSRTVDRIDRRQAARHCSMRCWPLAKGKMFIAGADQPAIDEYVASERQNAMDELAAFLVANDLRR